MNIQVKAGHYLTNNYFNRERLNSYSYQIEEILKLNPGSVLEIGVGNKFISDYLKNSGVNLMTLDIDDRLKPDKVGSILSLPFDADSFDLIACFQVLEHLEYRDFSVAVKEIYRVAKNYALISLPDVERCFKLLIGKNNSAILKKYIEIPRRSKPEHKFDGEHYWEIGTTGYPLSKIYNDIKDAGFEIRNSYRIFENTYHRMFILDKNNRSNKQISWDKCKLGNLETWRESCFEENVSLKRILTFSKIWQRKNG